jgi:REP element-mobilizing transposase RayT
MSRTLGFHIVISGFGLWLPGDERGHWSEAWDDELGLIEPRTLHSGDPVRKRMAEERMTHAPVRLDAALRDVVAATLARCEAESHWRIAAASVEATHTHLLLTYSPRDIDLTVKWLKDRFTKAIHRETPHTGPVWCKGRWRSFVYDEDVWRHTQRYIDRHSGRIHLA